MEEVFDWLLEVEQGSRIISDDEAGRIVFTIAYSRHHGISDVALYPSDEVHRKVVGRVDIQYDNIQAIVPVIKVRASTQIAASPNRPIDVATYPLRGRGQLLLVLRVGSSRSRWVLPPL